MTLLIPLGLLGLMSIIALIVIYIIRPNYQHKEVTSTYVWKLSLKYRKKRLPTSKLRNIFLILCQVLALVAGALIMAQPIIRDEDGVLDREVIAIIDASASMRAEDGNGVTRFERAVNEVIELSNDTIAKGGYMSVILSNGNDSFFVQKAGRTAKDNLIASLNSLIESRDSLACSYGASDLNTSIELCEEVVKNNPTASVRIYTDRDYAYVPNGLTVVNVAQEGEWNVGILNAYGVFEEGYYSFYVEVGCYGGYARSTRLKVSINGASDGTVSGSSGGKSVEYVADVSLRDNSVTTVIFKYVSKEGGKYVSKESGDTNTDDEAENIVIVPVGPDAIGNNKERVVAFDDVFISIDEADSLESDNSYSIYGGRKPELKILYATTKKMKFMTTLLDSLKKEYSASYDVVIDIVDITEKNPETSGYDFYIFQRCKPKLMPGDGLVWLFWPPELPDGMTPSGVQTYKQEMSLLQDSYHPIIQNIAASEITVTQLIRLSSYDTKMYQSLWSVDNNPVLLFKDGEFEKTIVTLFDLEFSNFGITEYLACFGKNIFDTYFSPTIIGNAFEVGEEITVNARGKSVTMRDSGSSERVFTEFPAKITLDTPDTYTFSQMSYFAEPIQDHKIFVKIPASESNIAAQGLTLKSIYHEATEEDQYQDLLVYIAAAMLALLFTEWFLHTQESL